MKNVKLATLAVTPKPAEAGSSVIIPHFPIFIGFRPPAK